MANPYPDLYTIRVNAKPVEGSATKRTLCGTIAVDVVRKPLAAKGRARKIADPSVLVVRPGDSIQFELGDVPFKSKEPNLRIRWKFPAGPRWKEAPKRPGQVAQIPPASGFAGARFSFHASIDLNVNLKLPAQSVDSSGNTVIELDPDVVVDEC